MTYFPPPRDAKLGPGGELVMAEKNLQIYVSPSWGNGESAFRVRTTENGSATVSVDNNSEWNLTTTAVGTDDCDLTSLEYVKFFPGQSHEIGHSMRLPDALTGSQFAEWGIDDSDTGAGFGRDATGYYVWVRLGGAQTKVYSTSWNVDDAGGTGPSGLSLDATTSTRFIVEFSSSFLGLIDFSIYLWNTSTYEMEKVLVHRWAPSSGAVDSMPQCPIIVRLDNGGTATARDIFCQEFWFSTAGSIRHKSERYTNQFRFNLTPGTTPIPTVSYRRKSGFNKSANVKVFVAGFDLSTTDDLLVYVRTNASLTGASWGVGQTPADETVTETDISATASNTGNNRFIGIYGAGNHIVNLLTGPKIYMPEDEPLHLYIRTLTGTATRVDVLFRIVEEW